MALNPDDIAAIACGGFLVLCCSVVMIIHLCRPELLNPKLAEQMELEKEREMEEGEWDEEDEEGVNKDEMELNDL